MRILLDHCVDGRLGKYLPEHEVKTTLAMGWDTYKNGTLLTAAQAEFDVFLTVDQNIPYQQNMRGRPIALVIMKAKDNRLNTLAKLMPEVGLLLPTVLPGQVYHVFQKSEDVADTKKQSE